MYDIVFYSEALLHYKHVHSMNCLYFPTQILSVELLLLNQKYMARSQYEGIWLCL